MKKKIWTPRNPKVIRKVTFFCFQVQVVISHLKVHIGGRVDVAGRRIVLRGRQGKQDLFGIHK